MNDDQLAAPSGRLAGDAWMAALFLTAVPLLAHLAFSWMGFDAGNHGLILAGSRRILNAQWPWRDFLAWHPPLPYLLHLPLAAFRGDRVFWWARLVVWLELAAAAWFSTGLVCRAWALAPRKAMQPLLALAALAVSVNILSIDLHPAVDAWFFAAIGLSAACNPERALKAAGYLLLGAAVICEHSFILVGITAMFVWNDWRRPGLWLLMLFPALLTILWLVGNGLLTAALTQMEAGRPWLQSLNWLRGRGVGFLLVGYLGMRCLCRAPPVNWPRRLLNAASWALLGLWPVCLVRQELAGGLFRLSIFSLFWLVAGICVYALLDNRRHNPAGRGIALVALSAALAVMPGQNYMVFPLLAGMLLLVSVAWLLSAVPGRMRVGLALLLALFFLQAMSRARSTRGYYAQPAEFLAQPLHQVLPGGMGILVNSNVYAFLEDFQQARELAAGTERALAVIPEIPAYWVCATQVNLMPADLLLLPRGLSTNLVNTITARAREQGAALVVINQKIHAARLDRGMRRLGPRYNPVALEVTREMRKIAETRFFEIYERPPE